MGVMIDSFWGGEGAKYRFLNSELWWGSAAYSRNDRQEEGPYDET